MDCCHLLWACPLGTPGPRAGGAYGAPWGPPLCRWGARRGLGSMESSGCQLPGSAQSQPLDSSEFPQNRPDMEQDCPLRQTQLFERLQGEKETPDQLTTEGQQDQGRSGAQVDGEQNPFGGWTPASTQPHLHSMSVRSNVSPSYIHGQPPRSGLQGRPSPRIHISLHWKIFALLKLRKVVGHWGWDGKRKSKVTNSW